jgi:hypothetical protein
MPTPVHTEGGLGYDGGFDGVDAVLARWGQTCLHVPRAHGPNLGHYEPSALRGKTALAENLRHPAIHGYASAVLQAKLAANAWGGSCANRPVTRPAYLA